MLRKLLSTVLGVLVGGVVVMLVELVGHFLFPLPDGTDMQDKAALAAYVAAAPFGALLFPVLAWFLGALAGGWVAARVARQVWPAIAACTVLLAFTVWMLLAIPHPVWMMIAGVLVYPLAAFIVVRLAGGHCCPHEETAA